MINRNALLKVFFLMLLTGVVIVPLFVQPAMAAYFVQPDAYWKLEEADPGTDGASDAIGTIDGTCTNCPTSDTGQVGNGFVFNGTDTEVDFADNAVFDFAAGASVSIELWMKLDGIPASRQVMIGRDSTSNSTHWWLAVNNDGTAGCYFIDSDGPSPASSLRGYSNVADNNWHHIVAVRDGVADTLMIYVDGVLEGAQDQSVDTSTDGSFDCSDEVSLGHLPNGAYWYAGMLDNVALHSSSALTADVILQNYLNGMQNRELDEEFAPVFGSDVSDTAIVGYTATLRARAAGNPMPTYSATGLPDGASIGSASGDITWMPTDVQVGSNLFSVSAANSQGSSAAPQNWTVMVKDLCTTDLEAYWKLEETDPGTDGVSDAAGTIDGTCTNCPTSDTGQVGSGFVFNGTDTEVDFADNAVFDFAAGASVSIELWMKLDGIPASRQVMIGRDSTSNSTHWWLAVNNDGTAGCYFIDSDGPSPASSLRGYSNVADNNWHHIVAVRDGVADTLMIYVDGVLEGTQDQSGDTSTDGSFDCSDEVSLGNLPNGAYWYGGMLDEVAMYGTALSATAIAQHANADTNQSHCNAAPTIDSTPVTAATEDTQYTYNPTASDPDGHDIADWSLTQNPSGMTINSSSGQITWTPGEGVLTADVTIQVTDEYGATGTQAYTITVAAVNDAPVISTTCPTTATEGVEFTYDADATDEDSTTLTWSLSSDAPSGMTVDAATGEVTWTPAVGSAGDVSFTLQVSDGDGGSDQEAITITVSAAGTNGGSGDGGGGSCFIGALEF